MDRSAAQVARHHNRQALYNGLLRGGISFSVMQTWGVGRVVLALAEAHAAVSGVDVDIH